MERHEPLLSDTIPWVSCAAPRTQVVIFDDGHSAWIRRVPATLSLEVGSRLRYAGLVWRITDRRPHAKALVARPIPH